MALVMQLRAVAAAAAERAAPPGPMLPRAAAAGARAAFGARAGGEGKQRKAPTKPKAKKGAGDDPAGETRVLVFGGSGYVGRRVCRSLVDPAGTVRVTSVSRHGCFSPVAAEDEAWAGRVEWMRADAAAALLDGGDAGGAAAIEEAMRGADAVVSCLGAFGSDAFMHRMNGDVNVALARRFAATSARPAPRFVFVSTAPFRLPEAVLRGYFNGKRRAEDAALECFGDRAVVLRPSFVHGTRDVPGNIRLPLGLVGRPLEAAAAAVLPSLSPISVDDVGVAAAAAALGRGGAAGVWEYDRMVAAARGGGQSAG